MSYQVAVCGPGECTPDDYASAEQIGQKLAGAGAVVLCGGGTGVMAAAAAGARSAGGLVVGVRPDTDRAGASPDLSAALFTNMGEARNAILVWSADAVIVVAGSWGTLSELALAKRRGDVPVICLGGWHIHDANGAEVPGLLHVGNAADAVEAALRGRRPAAR